MRKILFIAALAVVLVFLLPFAAAADRVPVGTLLTLAVDVSGSINSNEFNIQRDGYANAFRNTVANLFTDPNINIDPIGVNFMYWSQHQVQTLEWHYIDSAESAIAFGDMIAAAERPDDDDIGRATDISGAIDAAVAYFDEYALSSSIDARRVIDVSGDGEDNVGSRRSSQRISQLEASRDAAVSAGVTINGLPILTDEPELDQYFIDHVIGGDGAFVQPAAGFGDFASAIDAKLYREITQVQSAATPEPGTMILLGSAGGIMPYLRRRRRNPAKT